MSIGFGLEKIGRLTLRFPRILAALVIAFTSLCAFQLTGFSIDGDLLRLYRGSGDRVDRYIELNENFGTFENDVYFFIQSDDLTDPEAIEQLRLLALELELDPFASGSLSPFTLRQPTEAGTSVPAVPENLQTREAVADTFTRLRQTDPIMSNLVSPELTSMVMMVFPDAQATAQEGENAMIASLQDVADRYRSETLNIEITGPPLWTQELIESSGGEQLLFMGAGLLLGFVTALLAFRAFWTAVIATVTPAITSIWAAGGITMIFGTFTFLTNIVTALVLVIAFAESMYFCFYWLRQREGGSSSHDALRETVDKVSPACALTALTTILAFTTLLLASGQGLQEFAISGALGIAFAFLALVTFLPLSILLALRLGYAPKSVPSGAIMAPIRPARRLTRIIPRTMAVGAMILTLALLIPHFLLEPRFSFQDFLPRDSETLETSGRIDEGVGGVSPIYITLALDAQQPATSPDNLERIEAAQDIAESYFGQGKVLSAASFDAYSNGALSTGEVIDALGPFLRQRFFSSDDDAALITAFSETSSSAQQTMDLVEGLRTDLDAAGLSEAEVTGFRVVSAFGSVEMIRTLQFSLSLAVVLSLVLIGTAFRSIKIAFIAMVPNAFPILATELFLYSSGIQLQLTSVISLTIAFGVAVDDTIHFLAHYARARQRGEDVATAVDSTLERVGPALVATTAILIAGCAVLLLSVLPQVAMFGGLTVLTLLAALVGDLIILPSLLVGGQALFSKFGERYHALRS